MRQKNPNDTTLISAVITYGAVFLTLVIVYSLLVRWGILRWLLEPRGKAPLSKLFFGNGLPQIREIEFINQCGIDAYMSVRGIRLMASILTTYCFSGSIILLPTYRLQQQSDNCIQICSNSHHSADAESIDEACLCSSIDRFTLATLAPGSHVLWVPVLAITILSVITLHLIQREYREVVRIRASYWLSVPLEMFTVLVDDIPTHIGLHTEEGIRNHFEKLFPGQVQYLYTHFIDIFLNFM